MSETTKDGSGNPDEFDAGWTAFSVDEPPDWFICGFYETGFPRQNVQSGAYTITARFGRDHADALQDILGESSRYHLYIVTAGLNPMLKDILRDKHGVWRGSLFPDPAGAAATAGEIFPAQKSITPIVHNSR